MSKNRIFIGNKELDLINHQVEGKLVNIDNEIYYKISNNNLMRPFFISLVSDSNHWMFISSNGGISAGRKNSDHSLFPYYTDDKITESSEITGSKTLIQIHKDEKTFLWEPFSDKYEGIYTIERNLYKNHVGNKIIFEEINRDLKLVFKYEWSSSNQFGFVKKSTLLNYSGKEIYATILDGIQNLVPAGIESDFQNIRSNLVDAYKKNELDTASGIGIFALSAIIVDKAEPSESLKSTLTWSIGFDDPEYLISSLQLNSFRRGEEITQETDIKAEKGAYFVKSDLRIKPDQNKSWLIVANVNQTVSSLKLISSKLKDPLNLLKEVQNDVDQGTNNLMQLTGASDGHQLTADKLSNIRHYSNTLFNIMRGGIFDNNYKIEKGDFIKYISKANKKVHENNESILNHLPKLISLKDLKKKVNTEEDKDFQRLCFEYLPLKFSRRHGDPSRPWNKFSINTHNEIDGSKILDYEGNWRDIFQNWEALAHSYPEFIDSMIFKFLNATTFDGYNPYRVTKDGFDWEVIEPDDPWSYIGYWGDHQIVYLLKFLEFSQNYYPGKLSGFVDKEIFVYANVPYKIKKYDELLKNPKDTIQFDEELNKSILQLKNEIGADGALLRDRNFSVYKVNLIEKLLSSTLAKISNFIPGGGIWMNTQRPEWNDANNALVGNGVSMVTLYYLRRFITFFKSFVEELLITEFRLSIEVATFFKLVIDTLEIHKNLLNNPISDKDRMHILDGLGKAGSDFRNDIYNSGFSGVKENVKKTEFQKLFILLHDYFDHTIDSNLRSDHMYHAYNLMSVKNDTISITRLPEMLEGQVAVLSSGRLSSSQTVELLDSLKNSDLFREDQYSYLLYPNKKLPSFTKKNNISIRQVERSKLLSQLLDDGNNSLIEKDINGDYHFNGTFNNIESLKLALHELPSNYQQLVDKDRYLLFEIFEDMFDHKSFTGRSGTFFGYEGLGSIYWHMVSKLLLAVQENCLIAIENKDDDKLIGKLLEHYYEINEGIGVHKSPELYGAFPTDPYSHTPATKGAQQPGMTGQVKEDILSRIGELGVTVLQGKIRFNSVLLRKEEFLKKDEIFEYNDINGHAKELNLGKGSLCFTYCQVPIIYKLSDISGMKIYYHDGQEIESSSLTLEEEISKNIFERTGKVEKITVFLNY